MIKLLVVDDSALMRRLYGELFAAEGDFELTFARDGVEAIDLLKTTKPDVITLDVQMPQMGGLECLDRIMVERPTPVVMASSITTEGAAEAVRALALGAVDVIAKPGGAISLKMDQFGPALVAKVRAASQARLSRAQRLLDRVRARHGVDLAPELPRPRPRNRPNIGTELVLVGASTGGPPALDALFKPLPENFPCPILVAQHMPGAFTSALARRLDQLLALGAVEVAQPTPLLPGKVYIARGDADVILSERHGQLVAMSAPSSSSFRWHPSVDRMVDSALDRLAPERIVGVLLTGMGNDGAGAMGRLRAGGGFTLAESEESAVVWGMPGELVKAGGASQVASIGEMADHLMAAVGVR